MVYICYHGGHCCGIHHIHGMGYGVNAPNENMPAIKKKTPAALKEENDAGPYLSRPGYHQLQYNIFDGTAPVESRLDRIKRYIKWKRDARKYGVIEIVLQDYRDNGDDGYYLNQDQIWRDILIGLGFKKVSDCYNSNSTNRIHIYHLIVDKEKK